MLLFQVEFQSAFHHSCVGKSFGFVRASLLTQWTLDQLMGFGSCCLEKFAGELQVVAAWIFKLAA